MSGLDIAQAESNLATTRALIPVLERNREVALNRLAVLLGTTPGTLDGEFTTEGEIPDEPDSVTTGLPADLLRQRPDIRAAERRLASQTARIGVATADLYPRLAISGRCDAGPQPTSSIRVTGIVEYRRMHSSSTSTSSARSRNANANSYNAGSS